MPAIDETNEKMFLKALKKGVVPATGCTEPVAVALAAAKAMVYLDHEPIKQIMVKVSPNVMKNALAVMVPGVGEPGLLIAAAAGALTGDSSAGLSVIATIPRQKVPAIKELAHSGKIRAQVASVADDLYVEVMVQTRVDKVTVRIAGGHTNIYEIEKNQDFIFKKTRPATHQVSEINHFLQQTSLATIWKFATTVDLAKIMFMEQAGRLNMALAQAGLQHDYGIAVGNHLKTATTGDLEQKIVAYSAAASDARMGGIQLPAMSNSGSGNQGITATVPVCVTAKELEVDQEHLVRALTLSHLTALYIHSFLPVLSAFCATASAAMGAAAGTVYLRTGNYQAAAAAIKNMCGDVVGMVCDGAGCSCAMKVANSAATMCRAVKLALAGVVIPATNGLVAEDVDQTLRGIGQLATIGMKGTDPAILKVMLNK